MANILFVVYLMGILVRFSTYVTSISDILKDRIELSTALTSWKRVIEGLTLYNADIDPYAGDIFHEMPLMLHFFNAIYRLLGDNFISLLFVAIDVGIAVMLERIAKHSIRYYASDYYLTCSPCFSQLLEQKRHSKSYSSDSVNLLIKASDMKYTCVQVVAIYLLNPFTIATCIAKSTAIFNNLAIVATIFFMVEGNRAKCSVSLAIAAYISLYPIALCIPVSMFIAKHENPELTWRHRNLVSNAIQTVVCFLAAFTFLLYSSFIVQGDWLFLRGTFGFILQAPDLSPNLGIFWYFFTETFEHFRLFFLYVFQMNAVFYVAPLCIKLRHHPLFLTYVCLTLTSVFKSYPTYADTSVYLSLVPVFSFNFKYMNNGLGITAMFVVCTTLTPIQWYLWSSAGSANSNFFYAVTLLYACTQIIFVTDLLQAFLRRQFDLVNGTKLDEDEAVVMG